MVDYFPSKMIFLYILPNVTVCCIYLNILCHTLQKSLKMILLYYRKNQISFKVLLLHSFMTYYSGARVYEIVNNCLSAVCYLRVRKEKCLQNFCSTEKWIMLDITVKNIFKIITMSNNSFFIYRF